MVFGVLTIFPEMIRSFCDFGIVRRAVQQGRIEVAAINIRDYAEGRHQATDDRPFGGGFGMVMKPEPLAEAIRAARQRIPGGRVIHLSPQGKTFTQAKARELAAAGGLILVCGRYEGVDERVCLEYVDEEVSIGDYVLTGGEPAAMVIIDAVARLIPGVLGGDGSAEKDSFENGLLEYAHYTRPREFEGMDVPEVLLAGNHGEIEKWRTEMSMIRTFFKRPDLLEKRKLSEQEIDIIKGWCNRLEKLIQS
jgi:tRNA (guanine37-N1)-methyltransferase